VHTLEPEELGEQQELEGDRHASGDVGGSGDQYVSRNVRGNGDWRVGSDMQGSSNGCKSSKMQQELGEQQELEELEDWEEATQRGRRAVTPSHGLVT
jgi:hypothetical protein